MNPRVKNVKPTKDFHLIIEFTNGEKKKFNIKPFLSYEVFRELKDYEKFRKVKPFLGSIQWETGQDLCPDTLYLDSKNYS
ncbi:MAG: DUF2442 domain-containing protein [Bacteroidetes bacterium]|nr:MAG: DUF2442 domain-containing protein [Bacteroidota bacterium]